MTKETQTQIEENINLEQTENNITEPTPEKPKRTSRKKKEAEPVEEEKEMTQGELAIEVEPMESPELKALKDELAKMQEEKAKLEAERNSLNETISKLQDEVKITPQKIGKAIKDMGIEPLSMSRENPKAMTMETYNSMTDSARREWQRTHRAEYLSMMHNLKISQ
jgi:hypothetical protein